MTRLLVGAKELRGKLPNYAKLFDLVELRPVDVPLPTGKKLARWRHGVAPTFAFCVRLPAAVCSLRDDEEAQSALKAALTAARILQATTVLLITPPSVRPTQQNRERLSALRERLPADGHMFAWEALGLWEPEDAVQQARQSGFLPVLDGVQHDLPEGPVVYTRVHAMGNASSIGATRMTKLADQLRGRKSAFVVVDGTVARTVKAALTASLAVAPQARAVPPIFRPGPTPLLIGDEEQ